jgi:DNA-binding NarL/FixJ family response regulator
MVDGLVQKQIAERLRANPHTVHYVIRCIYRKLHVNCQAAAVSVAVRDGLVRRERCSVSVPAGRDAFT